MHCSLSALSALALILATQCVFSAPSWKPSAEPGPGSPAAAAAAAAAGQPSALGSGRSPPRGNDGSGDAVQPPGFARVTKPRTPPKEEGSMLGRYRMPSPTQDNGNGGSVPSVEPPQPVANQPPENRYNVPEANTGKPTGFLDIIGPPPKPPKPVNYAETVATKKIEEHNRNKAQPESPKPASGTLAKYNVKEAEEGKPFGFLSLIKPDSSGKPPSADSLLNRGVSSSNQHATAKPRSAGSMLEGKNKRAARTFGKLPPDLGNVDAGSQPAGTVERKNEEEEVVPEAEVVQASSLDHRQLPDVARISKFIDFLDSKTPRYAPRDLYSTEVQVPRSNVEYEYLGGVDAFNALNAAYDEEQGPLNFKDNLLLEVANTIRTAMLKEYKIPIDVEKQLFKILFGTETPQAGRTVSVGFDDFVGRVKDVMTHYEDSVLQELHKKLLLHFSGLTNKGISTSVLAESVATLLFASVSSELTGPRIEATKWLIMNAPLIYGIFD